MVDNALFFFVGATVVDNITTFLGNVWVARDSLEESPS